MPISYTIARDSGVFPHITEADIGKQIGDSKDIILRREDIHFYYLSDLYARDVPGYKPNVYSPGDLLLFTGFGLAVLQFAGEGVYGLIRSRSARSKAVD